MLVLTHSGKFHADDVLSWALLCLFFPSPKKLIRSRDPQYLEKADLIFDIGGVYDAKKKQFDHHQAQYKGTLSSAGMILLWLKDSKYIDEQLFERLQKDIVNHVDAVDNGITLPQKEHLDFTVLIDGYNNGCQTLEDFDKAYFKASSVAKNVLENILCAHNEEQRAIQTVKEELSKSDISKSNILFFDSYISWKGPYFQLRENHHTEFVIFQSLNKTWQAVAIPPELESFAQKRSFPESWAGKRGSDLAKITGFQSAEFCHKNRFIAVFYSLRDLLSAMNNAGLLINVNIDRVCSRATQHQSKDSAAL
ncbi:MAG: hypothetical protein CMK59_12050 [Proteobacteria bacterium]|nr:hypothetical protein [Pseudomonadota bacterium]